MRSYQVGGDLMPRVDTPVGPTVTVTAVVWQWLGPILVIHCEGDG